jgi:hypothetical protein
MGEASRQAIGLGLKTLEAGNGDRDMSQIQIEAMIHEFEQTEA